MNRPNGWSWCAPREFVIGGREYIVAQELELLKPAHWMDWSYLPITPSDVYTPMLWTGNDAGLSGAVNYLAEHPTGETILLWNEPERPEQANMSPEKARIWTQRFLREMWDTGVEFQWAAPGISINMQDYDGLAWLTEYVRLMRRTGISRPSYWHIHSYRANTVNQLLCAWDNWLEWWKAWGKDAPVVISEVCAENALVDQQKRIMDACRELLRLGQNGGAIGVYWFATHPTNVVHWPNAYLCELSSEGTDMQLTELGRHWIGLK